MLTLQARIYNLLEIKVIRDLNPSDINRMIAVSGMVTRTSGVIPDQRCDVEGGGGQGGSGSSEWSCVTGNGQCLSSQMHTREAAGGWFQPARRSRVLMPCQGPRITFHIPHAEPQTNPLPGPYFAAWPCSAACSAGTRWWSGTTGAR